jgi:large subunit ribosomal protein L25
MPIQLKLEKRTGLGSRESRRLRRKGFIPGVIYGQGSDVSIKMNTHEFMQKIGYAKSLGIVEIDIDGSVSKSIIKDVQWDALTDAPVHLDFQLVSDDQLVTVPVPVRLEGTPPGVSVEGGILDHSMHQLFVTVKASDIPSEIVFDVSGMQLNDRLHLSDVVLPDGLFADLTGNPVIASVIIPRSLLVKEGAAKEEEEEAEAAKGTEKVTEG